MISMCMALRNGRVQAIADLLDKGNRPATVSLYTGKRPRNGGATTTILATLKLPKPCGKVKDGCLVVGEFETAPGLDHGQATWARFCDGNGNQVMDASVGLDNEDILMVGSTAIATGQPVEISSAVFCEPEG